MNKEVALIIPGDVRLGSLQFSSKTLLSRLLAELERKC